MLLLVEDHKSSREALVRLLQYRGFETIAARTAEQAMQLAEHFKFDAIISDIGLPDLDGHTLMSYLHERYPDLPGIAMSAYSTPSVHKKSLAAGFLLHLTKPLNFEALYAALEGIKRG